MTRKKAPRGAPWSNRIVGYEELQVSDALFNPENWRVHPREQQEALAGVLRQVGIVQNVVVNKRTGHLVDGHLRVLLADREGMATVPATVVDLTEEEERLILATLDPLAALAGADKEKLDSLLHEVQTDDPSIQAMLSGLAEENGLYFGDAAGATEGEGRPKGTALDDLNLSGGEPETDCERGQVFRLGPHVLVVADVVFEAEVWKPLLEDGMAFAPYAGPFALECERALVQPFLIVQPNRFIAGHIVDAFKALHPDEAPSD